MCDMTDNMQLVVVFHHSPCCIIIIIIIIFYIVSCIECIHVSWCTTVRNKSIIIIIIITAPGDSSIYDYMQNRNENCMFLTPVDEIEVSRVVASCTNNISTDANELSMYIIKRIIVTIVTPITPICNLSFKNGAFPDKMKTGKIIPIFKSGNREDCTNYRPISLLPQISKILEKFFNKRITDFLEKYKVISPTQYGFRGHMLTCFAITELVDEITASLDKQLFTMGVFIYFKKSL